MKKTGILYRIIYGAFVAAGLLLAAPSLTAQVNRPELGTPGDIEFLNYVGPQSRIDTLAQIRAIGYDLGLAVSGGAAQAGATGRYFVIHSVSGPDGDRLDADIFGLGPDAGVDHIRNLRVIIQGYLEAAYGYSESDAALLSRYITIYNAVYRGDMNYFSSRYKNPVMQNVTQERAGLSIRYDEWPGQTLMLIPLGSGLGGPLSAIDTSTLSDDRVLEQLRQDPDMAIDDRREMVGLMEREADQAEQVAEVIRETIRQEEQSIPEERQAAQEQLQAAQEEVRAAQEEARAAQEELQQIDEERQQPEAQQPEVQEALDQRQEEAEQRQEEAEQRQEEAEQRVEEATQTLEELDRREEAVEQMRQEAADQEAFAEDRRDDAQQERQQIAEDQQSLMEQQPPVVPAEGVLAVSILEPASSLGRLVMVNDAGTEIRQSQLNTVNARTVTMIGTRIFAIAGRSQGTGAIRLVEIDPATLEMLTQGEDDIAEGSLLWTRGQDIYAIISSGGTLNLARFNADLVLQARSTIDVHQYASVLFNGGFLLTQRGNGSAALLDPNTLSER